MRWLRSLRFEDRLLAGDVRRLPVRRRDARRAARRADRRARAGDPRQPPRHRRSPSCAAFAGSTRSRPPGCAPRSATGSASGPSSSRGFSGSSRPSTPPTPSAARARSPRPARSTRAGCWSRPPTTTATGPPSATASPAAKPARTPGRSRSPGAPNAACTSAGRRAAPRAPQARRRRRDRLRPRTRRVLLGGRHPQLTPPPQPPRDPVLPGRARDPPGHRSSRRAVREPDYGQPPTDRPEAAPASRPRTATNTGS